MVTTEVPAQELGEAIVLNEQGRKLELGGAFVIDPQSVVRYYFAERKAGDHTDIEDLLQSLDALQSSCAR